MNKLWTTVIFQEVVSISHAKIAIEKHFFYPLSTFFHQNPIAHKTTSSRQPFIYGFDLQKSALIVSAYALIWGDLKGFF